MNIQQKVANHKAVLNGIDRAWRVINSYGKAPAANHDGCDFLAPQSAWDALAEAEALAKSSFFELVAMLPLDVEVKSRFLTPQFNCYVNRALHDLWAKKFK